MGGKKKKREWNEHVTRMDAERLVKISREEDHQDVRKEDGATNAQLKYTESPIKRS